jgi:hypothetical protein
MSPQIRRPHFDAYPDIGLYAANRSARSISRVYQGVTKLLTLAYLDYGFSAIGSIWLFNTTIIILAEHQAHCPGRSQCRLRRLQS